MLWVFRDCSEYIHWAFGGKYWVPSPADERMDQAATARILKAGAAHVCFISLLLVTLCILRLSIENMPVVADTGDTVKYLAWRWRQIPLLEAPKRELTQPHVVANSSVTVATDAKAIDHPVEESYEQMGSLSTTSNDQMVPTKLGGSGSAGLPTDKADQSLSTTSPDQTVPPQQPIDERSTKDEKVEDHVNGTAGPDSQDSHDMDSDSTKWLQSGVQPGPELLSNVSAPISTPTDAAHAGSKAVKDAKWIQFPGLDVEDETAKILSSFRLNGTIPCHNVGTRRVEILGLPEPVEGKIRLFAGPIYEILIMTVGDDDQPRCTGGDYFETDLRGSRWKSRPPVFDYENGTYSVRLQVDPRFTGHYTFTVILLFDNYNGLHLNPKKYMVRNQEVATYEIEFMVPNSIKKVPLPELPVCKLGDFDKKHWSGRWTRERANEDCEYAEDGRWQCVDTNLQCQEPWCQGPVGHLESNGWSYSAHCAFKIFREEEAWKCLSGRWLFFYGDSNHLDSIRNLLNFALGYNAKPPGIKHLGRRMDVRYVSPRDNTSSVRITSMFNGHANVNSNRQGLFSLRDATFAAQLHSYFTGDTAPDFMIMNSGLHDAFFWRNVESFQEDGVEFAARFWADVWNNMTATRPHILYRTTVAAAGAARMKPYNPQKMELYNHLMVDRLSKLKLERFHIIDGFDYTFPWHYDNSCSDGIHYGRPPSKPSLVDGHQSGGHRYFVDLMLVHMLLNAICAT